MIKKYLQDENAMDSSVEKIIFFVGTISLCTAVGYFIWNKLEERTAQSSCDNNPSPFCIE